MARSKRWKKINIGRLSWAAAAVLSVGAGFAWLAAGLPRNVARAASSPVSQPAAGAANDTKNSAVASEPRATPQPAAVRAVPASASRLRSLSSAKRDIDAILTQMESGRAAAPGGKTTARAPAQTAFLALSLDRDEAVTSHHATELLSGASNLKLFTTAAALTLLGPDYHYETRFASGAPVANGVLEGDLWILGGGDPSLYSKAGWCSSGFDLLVRSAAALVEHGIRSIRGDIVVDDRLFSDEMYHSAWPREDRGEAHALDVGALVLEHDQITVWAKADGDDVRVTLDPPTDLYKVTQSVRIGPTGALRASKTADGGLHVSGTVTRGGTESTSFFSLNPGDSFGGAFTAALRRCSIRLDGRLRRARSGETAPGAVLVSLPSPATLAQIVKHTNQMSDNLMADMILKGLGARFEGEGSFRAGCRAVRRALRTLGVSDEGYAGVDGSGLASTSKISPKTTVDLLCAMARGPLRDVYYNSLAVGGEAGGTLRKRFREAGFAGKVRAKTGTLDGASSLSGYVESASGETIVFSCIENYDERRGGGFKPDEDRIVRALRGINER